MEYSAWWLSDGGSYQPSFTVDPIKSINDTDDYKQWLLLILAYKQNINRTSQEFISVMHWFPAMRKYVLFVMQGKYRFGKDVLFAIQ